MRITNSSYNMYGQNSFKTNKNSESLKKTSNKSNNISLSDSKTINNNYTLYDETSKTIEIIMKNRMRELNKSISPIESTIAKLKEADIAAEEIGNTITEIKDLVTIAADETLAPSDIEKIQYEINDLIESIGLSSQKFNELIEEAGKKLERFVEGLDLNDKNNSESLKELINASKEKIASGEIKESQQKAFILTEIQNKLPEIPKLSVEFLGLSSLDISTPKGREQALDDCSNASSMISNIRKDIKESIKILQNIFGKSDEKEMEEFINSKVDVDTADVINSVAKRNILGITKAAMQSQKNK